ncbi:MAG TPA: NPCBM/NEW2 domain-containing protein, partial [Planctomycetota bacterium]|nr:NPCBM/NEW2 domain-containing protein [Planctomycetota bacterium]
DAEGRLVVVTREGEVARPLEEIREVVHPGAVPLARPAVGAVVLWSGQVLDGTVRGVGGDRGTTLSVEVPPAIRPVELPLRTVRALRTSTPHPEAGVFDEALQGEGGRDLLFAWRRGDPALGLVRLTVTVRRFVADGEEPAVVVEFDGKEQPAQALSRLYGLVFGSGAAPDPQEGARVTVHATSGATFLGRLVALDPAADRCLLRLDEGCDLELPWRHVARLSIRSDRLVYLSDLEPVSVEQTPALSRTWPWLKDRAPGGPGLVLGGKRYERGLVLVPRTRLVYDLHERYDRFAAVLGIDDRAGDMGDAVVRVFGDDRNLLTVERVRRSDQPREVELPVAGVRRLILEVDFGENLDFGDHCVFAEARVLRDR